MGYAILSVGIVVTICSLATFFKLKNLENQSFAQNLQGGAGGNGGNGGSSFNGNGGNGGGGGASGPSMSLMFTALHPQTQSKLQVFAIINSIAGLIQAGLGIWKIIQPMI